MGLHGSSNELSATEWFAGWGTCQWPGREGCFSKTEAYQKLELDDLSNVGDHVVRLEAKTTQAESDSVRHNGARDGKRGCGGHGVGGSRVLGCWGGSGKAGGGSQNDDRLGEHFGGWV